MAWVRWQFWGEAWEGEVVMGSVRGRDVRAFSG